MTGYVDGVWHCACGARNHHLCRCWEAPLREALYARLAASGVQLDAQGRALPVEALAAVLVAVEDPYWAEGDSARNEDAATMIHLIRRELA